MARPYRPSALASIVFALAIVLWVLPRGLGGPLLYLNTFCHEAGHALAALLTGGEVRGFVISPGGGGYAETAGGWPVLVFSCGYLGTTLAGVGLLWLNARPRLRGRILMALGVAFWLLAAAYARTLFTGAYGLAAGAVAIGLGVAAHPSVQYHLVTILGLTLGLDAVDDLVHLCLSSLGRVQFVPPPGLGHSLSDAEQLARHTGVPALAWSSLWTLLSVAALAWALDRLARAD